MFNNPFSFEGRIRRFEYGISILIYFFIAVLIKTILKGDGAFIIQIPMLWFLWAQGAKRCHDVGNNGWYQLIPFYIFWLLFQSGEIEMNEYGRNPKEIVNPDEQNQADQNEN